jgi:hypothetical protein
MPRKFFKRLGRSPTLQTTPDATKFFGSAGALPSRKTIRHSLLTIRYSLPFWLGRSLALPFLASSLVLRPTTRFKSVSMVTKPAKAG